MSRTHGPNIVLDNLVLYLDAANRKSYSLEGQTITAPTPDPLVNGSYHSAATSAGNFIEAVIPFTLLSVDLYTTDAQSQTIELRDGHGRDGTLLESTTVSLSPGKNEVALNFTVPEGDTTLLLPNTSNIWRNNTGVSYPYSNDFFSFVNSVAGTSFFYYTYNVKASVPDTSWKDLTKNAYDLTLVNGPVFNSGNLGYLDFDGTNEYGVNTSFSLNINSGATISAWINTDNPQDSGGSVVSTDFQNNSRFYVVVNAVQGGRFQLGLGESVIISNVFASDSTWEFVTLTANNGNYKFYVNGVLSETGTYTPSSNPLDKFYVGNTFTTTGGYTGLIAQVSLYNRDLSESEIRQNFESTRSRYGI